MLNTTPIFNAGIYIRLSREDEKEKESSSVESQRDYLLSYLMKHGYTFKSEYVDDGYSGTNFERPSFKRLLEDIETGKINMVVVKDLSRLGRNNSKVSYYLDEYFPVYNVRFIAINNDYDSAVESASQEYAWITNGMNENYCLDISKKVRSALKVRMEKGYFIGWKAPYGYLKDKNDNHKLIIDPKTAPVVKRIFNLAYHGKSASQIANILSTEKIPNPSSYANLRRKSDSLTYHLWCARTISEMITNETYIGNLTQGRRKKINYKVKKEVRLPVKEWNIVYNTHPPIIDKTIFFEIQHRLKKHKHSYTKNNKLLSPFLFCFECGHSISVSKSGDGKRYYLGCTYYRKYSKFSVCTPHTMNYDKFEKMVLDACKNLCRSAVNIQQLKNIIEQKISYCSLLNNERHKKLKFENSITQLTKIIDSIYIDMKKGNIDIARYERVKNELEAQIVEIYKSMETIEKNISHLSNNKCKNYEDFIIHFLNFKNPSYPFLLKLIDRIYIDNNKKIKIYLKCNHSKIKL